MIDAGTVGTEVVLQNGIEVKLEGPSSLVGGAVGAFATTLVVGAILTAIVPDYTERMVGEILDDLVASFLYCFLGLILLAVSVVALALTVVGILVAIPLVVLVYLAWAVRATVVFLTVGDRLVGHEDGWLKLLLIAAAINGGSL